MVETQAFEWWRGASLYQIYPRSFLDTTGTGIGDLPGITDRLGYVASLGVDGIWISPFFPSPMHDFGYDVADFCDVDKIFGSLADFDHLIATAHELGLKVVIDQVYSHSSSEHPWFTESRSSKENPKSDWYVWADARPDGTPPNNWLSIFGGPAWTWDARRQQYYLHNFLSTQPDLNLHHPDVQENLLSVARFWLDRGVDGFRLDAINFGMHNTSLADNPVADTEVWCGLRPVDMQKALNNSNQPELLTFIERLRNLMDQYDSRFTVAEVGGKQSGDIRKQYTKGSGRLNSAYGFEFLYLSELSSQTVADILQAWSNQSGNSWPSWAFSNHDVVRAHSRWLQELSPKHRASLITLFLISLRGNIFLYQGEELGLPQADLSLDDVKDPEALRNWPHTLGRDGARTPMPWHSTEENAGFSSARPWLPISDDHLSHASDSPLGGEIRDVVTQLLSLRRESPCLKWGDLVDIKSDGDTVSYARTTGEQRLNVFFNFSGDPVRLGLINTSSVLAMVSADGFSAEFPEELPPWSGILYYPDIDSV